MTKPKIIAVDDQPENLRLIVEMLKNDYSVIATTNPLKTLELATIKPQANVILLDVSMPEMNGYEVIAELKSHPQSSKVPVIFVTSDDFEDDYAKGISLGAFDYVNKPISQTLLKQRIKNAIAAS